MTFPIEVTGRNLEVTDRISEYVTKKVGKLDRFLSEIDDARVDLVYIKSARSASDRQVAEITVRGKGFILRAEESSDDIYSALDTAVDKMQRRIERYKGKHYHSRGNGRSAAEVTETSLSEEELEESPIITRRKRFVIAPMDEAEAIEQMNMLGFENFFVFYNSASHVVNIIYRRRDGSYGLIEPEIK